MSSITPLGPSVLAPSFLPATAVLEVTYRCNHVCLFCSCPWFAPRPAIPVRKELTVEEWKALVQALCRMGICNIAFTGGEPLLKKGILDLIEWAACQEADRIETEGGTLVSKKGPPRLYLLTNGKILSDDVLKICGKHSVNLSISFPGLDTFREHTGGRDGQHVLEWFRRAKAANVTTTAGITVTKKNIHELFETMAEALLAGADTILLNRFMPGGRGLRYAKELSLAPADITTMLDTAEEVLRAAGRYGHVGTELPKCLVDVGRYKHLKVGTQCSAGREFFVVGPSGYVRACNHSPRELAHFRDIEGLKHDPYWKSFVMKDYLPSGCRSCRWTNSCDGGCREAAHIVGGRIDSPDPLFAGTSAPSN